MTHDDIDNTPVSMLSIEDVIRHLWRRDSVNAMVVLSDELCEDGDMLKRAFVFRQCGTPQDIAGLFEEAREMLSNADDDQ